MSEIAILLLLGLILMIGGAFGVPSGYNCVLAFSSKS